MRTKSLVVQFDLIDPIHGDYVDAGEMRSRGGDKYFCKYNCP